MPEGAVSVARVEIPPHIELTEDTTVAVLSVNVRLTEKGQPQVIRVPLLPAQLAQLAVQANKTILSQVLFGAAMLTRVPVGRRATVVPTKEANDEEVSSDLSARPETGETAVFSGTDAGANK